jgi:autotransporter-associated beta strand protein
MSRVKAFSLFVATATVIAVVSSAKAQVALTEFVWDNSKTGNQQWQQSGNWAPSGFPNGPLQTANLSRPLSANLNVNVGATDVTVAGLTLGGTSGPRTTEISSSGGRLTFRNELMPPTVTGNADHDGNTFVDGHDFLIWQRGLGLSGQTNNNNGDGDADTVVSGPDLQIWKNQFGRGSELFSIGGAFLHSIGAAGSVHTISAGVHLNNDQLEIGGSTPLTINGNITYVGDAMAAGASSAALRVVDTAAVVTINGNIAFANNDALESIDFNINDIERAQGRLIINGIVSGEGDIRIGSANNAARLPLSTVELNGNNTYNGSIRAARGNLVLGHDHALGFNPTSLPEDQYATFRQEGPANQFGYNIISTDDARTINNPMVIAQWQTFKGDHSITWAGEISQTNNRGVINVLSSGKTLTLSGRVNVFEEAEIDVVREFEIDGTGKTVITGSIRDLPDDAMVAPQDHRLTKRGSGVLVVDVPAGGNFHIGDDLIYMGNWHYADNDSLNAGGGQILARGGAIGVDTGVSNNAALLAMIRPTSTGGLMLAPSDAAATLDFTGVLTNAANMTVAAPETGMNFSGSITPAGGRYQLGGGTGTLTLPNAQLTGGNRVELRNGGTIQLLGDNTYTGSTTLLTKYTLTHEAEAAVDSNDPDLSVGPLYYRQVAPTLVVDKLANSGQASSIGAASSDAANLLIQGSTLKYIGSGDTTDRLFTVGTGGATINASGSGPLVFSNAGALGIDEAEDRPGTLDDVTLNRDANTIYNVADTSDIVIGMTVLDPDPGGQPFSPNPRLQANTVITGISDNGTEIGIDKAYGFIRKVNTRIVFGTVPRTLTLDGSNTGTNTLASLIGTSSKNGVVNVEKTGDGTWVLTGNNTYTGATSVNEGTLLINGAQIGGGAYSVAAGATLGGSGTLGGSLTASGVVSPGAGVAAGILSVTGGATFATGSTALFQLGGTAANQFDQLNLTGALAAGGTLDIDLIGGFNPSAGNSFDILDFTTATGSFTLSLPGLSGGLAWNTASLLTTGTISVVSASVAIPEPGSLVLAAGALAALAVLRLHSDRRRVSS